MFEFFFVDGCCGSSSIGALGKTRGDLLGDQRSMLESSLFERHRFYGSSFGVYRQLALIREARHVTQPQATLGRIRCIVYLSDWAVLFIRVLFSRTLNCIILYYFQMKRYTGISDVARVGRFGGRMNLTVGGKGSTNGKCIADYTLEHTEKRPLLQIYFKCHF